MNFSNKYHKILVTDPEDRKYYEFDQSPPESNSSALISDNNLNLITKFREENLMKYKEIQEKETKIYLRDQLNQYQSAQPQKTPQQYLKAKRDKRRLLEIAMRTQAPASKPISKTITQKAKNPSKIAPQNYSATVVAEITENPELEAMSNFIKNTQNLTQQKSKGKGRLEQDFGIKEKIRFDFDKIKELYNVSLLENGMMTEKQILERRKTDTKNAIINLAKRQKEEKILSQELEDNRLDKEKWQPITKKLKICLTSQEVVIKRIDFLIKGTNLNKKVLEEEIQAEKYQNSRIFGVIV